MARRAPMIESGAIVRASISFEETLALICVFDIFPIADYNPLHTEHPIPPNWAKEVIVFPKPFFDR